LSEELSILNSCIALLQASSDVEVLVSHEEYARFLK
jgi:hypothetical protein